MRYRPLGPAGGLISAVSLRLAPERSRSRGGDWAALIGTALDCGINGFHLEGLDAPLAEGLARAFEGVDRGLMLVSWRAGRPPAARPGREVLAPGALDAQVRAALGRTGLGWFDAVLVEDGVPDALQALKGEGLVSRLGLAGEPDETVAGLGRRGLELLAMPFNIASGWRERRLLREAAEAGLAVLATSPYPQAVQELAEGASRPSRSNPLAGAGTYAFLGRTRGWTGEEIAVAWALCEPALSSVLVRPASAQHIERMAAAADRDLPPGLGAQIEMARFTPGEALRRA